MNDSFTGQLIEKIESVLVRSPWVPLLLLGVFYCFRRLPDILYVNEYVRMVYPTFALYAAKYIFLPGGTLNAGLADTVIAPSNTFFIYPPGTYLVTYYLDRLSRIFGFVFLAQLFVPIFAYRLFLRATTALPALLIAMVLAHYGTLTQPHPDYLIQPLMLLALLFQWNAHDRRRTLSGGGIALIGALAGMITVFKHNLGIFYGVLVVTLIFFNSFQISRESRLRSKISVGTLAVILTGYLGFGIYFATRVIHLDEGIYFLVPYFIFWITVSGALLRGDAGGFDWVSCLRACGLFAVCALFLPVLTFMKMGGLVGFGRYVYALFGMGFKHLPVWDLGLIHSIQGYVTAPISLSRGAMLPLLNRGMMVLFFLLPAGVNLAFALSSRKKAADRMFLSAAAVGVIGIFLLFPLEDFRILQTKLFLYFFPAFFLLSRLNGGLSRVKVGVTLALALIACNCWISSASAWVRFRNTPTAGLNSPWASTLNVPIYKPVAEAMDEQWRTISRSVGDADFYTLNFDSEEMVALLLSNVRQEPQYYIDLREALLEDPMTQDVIKRIAERPFVLVHTADLENYLKNASDGPLTRKILRYVVENYEVVDRFQSPSAEHAGAFSGLYSFVVMKRHSP